MVDLDGTLLDKNGVISAEDRDALTEARNLGIQVTLSTGRSILGCFDIIERLSLDGYHVTFDGALVNEPHSGEEVYIKPLGEAVLKEAIEFARSNDISLELYSTTHYFAEQETWSTEAHRDFFGFGSTLVDFNGLWERERIVKGGLVAASPQEADKAQKFCRYFENSLSFSWVRTPAYPGVDFINIVSPEVSKGKALEALASYLGIPLAEVIAIGDGTNDISLLSAAGLAVAMGNAPDEVKAAADYITLDVDHNGLAVAINEFLV